MSEHGRVLAVVFVFLGTCIGLFTGAAAVPMCLGPLGVTPVQCARATGVIPGTAGIGLPILALTLVVAIIVFVPAATRSRAGAAVGAFAGGAVGGCVYLAFRPRTMEALDSTGDWISIVRPLDVNALVTILILGALLGGLGGAILARLAGELQRATSQRT